MRLVISDQHLGLKAAVEEVLVGSAWQRCRVHFMRNVLARVHGHSTHMVIAAIQTIFAQPDGRAGQEHSSSGSWPRSTSSSLTSPTMLTDAKEDLWPSRAFPEAHWPRSGRPTRSSG